MGGRFDASGATIVAAGEVLQNGFYFGRCGTYPKGNEQPPTAALLKHLATWQQTPQMPRGKRSCVSAPYSLPMADVEGMTVKTEREEDTAYEEQLSLKEASDSYDCLPQTSSKRRRTRSEAAKAKRRARFALPRAVKLEWLEDSEEMALNFSSEEFAKVVKDKFAVNVDRLAYMAECPDGLSSGTRSLIKAISRRIKNRESAQVCRERRELERSADRQRIQYLEKELDARIADLEKQRIEFSLQLVLLRKDMSDRVDKLSQNIDAMRSTFEADAFMRASAASATAERLGLRAISPVGSEEELAWKKHSAAYDDSMEPLKISREDSPDDAWHPSEMSALVSI